MNKERTFRVDDWVEVRCKEEILRTLDSKGQLDGMPFMPEMLQFCGQRFQVFKRAHKTCDYTTVHPFHTRRLESTVHLNTRCSGDAHDGCQAGCLLYWKQAWLKPVTKDILTTPVLSTEAPSRASSPSVCSESTLFAQTRVSDSDDQVAYVCQATQVPYATAPLAWWDLRQYLEDYWSGNVGLGRILTGLVYSAYYNLSQAGIGLGPVMRWLYNVFRPIWRGSLFPRTPGRIPQGKPTPTAALNLEPGELVRVKSHEEILNTVDTTNRNRGMHWDAELVPYCGGTYRVLSRVTRIIDERTRKMQPMKTPSIILDSVVCQARYSSCRMHCPKAMYPYWREIWLERAETDSGGVAAAADQQVTAVSSR